MIAMKILGILIQAILFNGVHPFQENFFMFRKLRSVGTSEIFGADAEKSGGAQVRIKQGGQNGDV